MEIEYSSEEVKNQCESVKAAKKLFNVDELADKVEIVEIREVSKHYE